MVNTVIANGNIYTDDSDLTTGLANGGHRERLIPLFSDSLAEIAALKVATESSAGATLWVSGVDGAIGESKISPSNLLTYRRKNTGAFTTDPSADPTNWTPISYVGRQTMFIPAGAMSPTILDGAGVGRIQQASSKIMMDTRDFSGNAQDEYCQFTVQMPESWNIGTLSAQFIWSHAATTVNFGVRFFIQAVALTDGDLLSTTFGTAVGHTADVGGVTDTVYITPETGAITVANTPAKSDLVVFQIYRDISDAGDTLAIDARLHGVSIYYTTDAATDD